jgi:hypothetical protein
MGQNLSIGPMTGMRLRLATLRGVWAVTELGRRRAATCDVRGADAAFRLAIDSGDLHAALHRRVLHARKGDPRHSRDAYREAVRLAAAHESTSAGEACVHIGGLLGADYGFLPGAGAARLAFEDIISSGDRDLAPKAALGLAMMLWGIGEPHEVRAAFRLAIDSGHPECAATAEKWLATYCARTGVEVGKAEPQSDDNATNNGDGLAADLSPNLWLCPACGALYIINRMVFPEDADGCDECHPTVTGATTEAVALELTGWSEERLLHEAYMVATEVARMHPAWGATPFVEEIERRLGMSPPVPGEGPDMDQVEVATVTFSRPRDYMRSQPTREGESYISQEHLSVDQALDVFIEVAAPKTPIVDEGQGCEPSIG